MNIYHITVHLSNDFRRTCMFIKDDGFENAALDGVYDGAGFTFSVLADSHDKAAEIAYAICNSYQATENYEAELHCNEKYASVVECYRLLKNRSLSVGDMLMISNWDQPDDEDGRYGVASFGFERF